MEDEEMNLVNAPCYLIKGTAKEGDCLYFNGEYYIVDTEGRFETEKRIKSKFENLKKGGV